MIEKCDTIKKRVKELGEQLGDPLVLQDAKKTKELGSHQSQTYMMNI